MLMMIIKTTPAGGADAWNSRFFCSWWFLFLGRRDRRDLDFFVTLIIVMIINPAGGVKAWEQVKFLFLSICSQILRLEFDFELRAVEKMLERVGGITGANR